MILCVRCVSFKPTVAVIEQLQKVAASLECDCVDIACDCVEMLSDSVEILRDSALVSRLGV